MQLHSAADDCRIKNLKSEHLTSSVTYFLLSDFTTFWLLINISVHSA